MQEVELILNKIIEVFNTPLAITSGVTLTIGSLVVMTLKFFIPKNKQLKASEILITEQRHANDIMTMKINVSEEQNKLLKEENELYKDRINAIAKRSRNKEIKALAIEEKETPTEKIKIKVVE